MIKLNEIYIVILMTVIFAVAFSFLKTTQFFIYALISIFLVITINIIFKKIAAFYFDSQIDIRLWDFKRYGFRKHAYFKKPFPAGIFFPLIISAITFGNILWMASFVFDVKPKKYRAAKRFGLYSFSEMTELHIGYIAAIGVVANLIFAILGYVLGFPDFARLNIYFAFFNMIPLSNLDGNKIYFGSLVLWSFLTVLTLIGLGYALFLI